MKKIFIRVLTIAIVATMFAMPITANATKLVAEPQPIAISVEEGQQDKLFIGKIKSFNEGMVEVEKLFDLENDFTKEDMIYIDVTSAEFPNGEVTEYPEGYLITVDYKEIVNEDSSFKIIATVVNAVEEDGVVTIAEENTTAEQNTTDESKLQVEEQVQIEPELCIEKQPSLWDKVVNFFRSIFG